jgi:hypothetical protein
VLAVFLTNVKALHIMQHGGCYTEFGMPVIQRAPAAEPLKLLLPAPPVADVQIAAPPPIAQIAAAPPVPQIAAAPPPLPSRVAFPPKPFVLDVPTVPDEEYTDEACVDFETTKKRPHEKHQKDDERPSKPPHKIHKSAKTDKPAP